MVELQEQWSNQCTTQLSIRAHKYLFFLTIHFHFSLSDAPAKLKKELDAVLILQADLDGSNKVLQLAWATIEKGNASPGVLDALASLECSHARLLTKAETLYSSLNVHDHFPKLTSVSLDFVWTLLMARNSKINIRKKAVGSFFEWDKLDCAVGGKDKPLGTCLVTGSIPISGILGTKLHQQTWRAIAKHQPVLMAAICKYNKYCEQLSQLHDSSWAVPLPAPLPTTLVDLCCDLTLMQDVWITPSVGEICNGSVFFSLSFLI